MLTTLLDLDLLRLVDKKVWTEFLHIAFEENDVKSFERLIELGASVTGFVGELFGRQAAAGNRELAIAMLRAGQRPHLGGGIERIAEADRLRQSDETVEELVGDPLLQDQPRAGDAGLALVVEDRPGAAVDRAGCARRIACRAS